MARSFSVTPAAFNAYVNWVLPAITGATRAATALFGERRDDVLGLAATLRDMLGLSPQRLFRGLLLEPARSARGILAPDPQQPYLSWTDDREVARKLADAGTSPSPTIEGFLVEYQPAAPEVLFHHTWAARFPLPGGRLGALAELAALHELIDARELARIVEAERVVITLPVTSPLVLLER